MEEIARRANGEVYTKDAMSFVNSHSAYLDWRFWEVAKGIALSSRNWYKHQLCYNLNIVVLAFVVVQS